MSDGCPLVGRDDEAQLIGSFVGRTRSRGGVLLLSGTPGVGKSVLCDIAAQAASDRGARVIRIFGRPAEAYLAFSGLHQLLFALRNDLDFRNIDDQNLLTEALALIDTRTGVEAIAVSMAVLELMRRLSVASPVLVVVDDAQWMDKLTRTVLGFAAHRLRSNPIGFLFAFRPSRELEGEFGCPVVEIGPLDERSSADLLDRHYPLIDPRVRRLALSEAQGNPLALIEYPRALQRSRLAAYLKWPLPFTQRLRRSVSPDVSGLEPLAKWTLLISALEGSGDLQLLLRATEEIGGLDCLSSAERSGLINVDSGEARLTFRDPLTRAAIVHTASNEERRLAHLQLADLLRDQPDRRPWHLAEAALEPDELLADLLEVSARRMLRNGSVTSGFTTLVRAAQLSAHASDRSRRLAQAAYIGASESGEWQVVSELIADALRADPRVAESPDLSIAASCLILNSNGDIDSAHQCLARAIDAAMRDREPEEDALLGVLRALGHICHLAGRPELWRPYRTAVANLPDHLTQDLRLHIRCSTNLAGVTRSDLEALDTQLSALDQEHEPSEIVRISTPALCLDRLAPCRPALWRVVESGRQGEAVGSAIEAAVLLSIDDFHTGRWDSAEHLALEALGLSQIPNLQFAAWPGWYSRGMVAAARGHEDSAKSLSKEIGRWALAHGALSVHHYASLVRVLTSLGQGDFEAVYQYAMSIRRAGEPGSFSPQALWVTMDLVEAAVRTGRLDEARAYVGAIRDRQLGGLSSRLGLLTAASSALVAPDGEADELFERAVSIDGSERWTFDFGRVNLLYGEYLRRKRSTSKSRFHLTVAMEKFDLLGAQPWLTRTRQELRAAGVSQPSSYQLCLADLTSQELEIAQLAASGLTNREIAKRLYLSHRTVGAHLYRIFPKLGVTTRAALRDALDDMVGESCA